MEEHNILERIELRIYSKKRRLYNTEIKHLRTNGKVEYLADNKDFNNE